MILISYIYLQLFQIPQRYRFSSKSQLKVCMNLITRRCFRYHKGTDFQANHNLLLFLLIRILLFQIPQRYRFSSKSQLLTNLRFDLISCFRYHKGTDFQANHNWCHVSCFWSALFQIPQRYRFSSKSQHRFVTEKSPICCFRYHKGTDFQANHN